MAGRYACTWHRCTATSRSSGCRPYASSIASSPASGRRTATTSTPGWGTPTDEAMNGPADERRLLRFDRVERLAHWALAVLFAVLMLTAIPLYVGSVAQLVGRRALLADIHSWCGVALPVPLLVSLLGPWGRGLRRDVSRLNLWTADERRWL